MNLNEHEIEQVLRKSPPPKPPAALKQRLIGQIASPVATNDAATPSTGGFVGWLRRWWPALAPAAVSLACAAVIIAQQTEARELRQGNLRLAEQCMSLSVTPASAPPNELNATDTAAAEQKEIARLNEQVAKLGSEVARLDRIQKENEILRKQPLTGSGLTEDELAAHTKAKEKAMSIQCVNNLKQVGLAVRLWALDNNDVSPPNFLSMSNELNTPKILVCPAETNRLAATNFVHYADENCSYEYLTPSVTNADFEPQRVLIRCPVHGHIGLCDGSVQGEVAMKYPERLVLRDGKLYFDSPAPGKPTPGNDSKP